MYFILIASIILGSIIFDQATKLLTVYFLEVGETVPLWEDVFHFTYVQNPGAAFGMLSDNRWVFMVVSVVAIVGVLFYLIKYRPTNKLLVISLSMIVGGGIGNMIDRVYLGYVVDFIDVRLINFAVFNIADSFVTVGACILVLYLVLDMVHEYQQAKAQKAEKDAEKDTIENQTGQNDE